MTGREEHRAGREGADAAKLIVWIKEGVIDWDSDEADDGEIEDVREQIEMGLSAIQRQLQEKWPHLDIVLEIDGEAVRP